MLISSTEPASVSKATPNTVTVIGKIKPLFVTMPTPHLSILLERQLALQAVVYHEYECRARRRPQAGDAAAAVQPAQAVLPPQRDALSPEGAALLRAAPGRRLHARFDGVGGEEEEVVRHARGCAGNGLLPEGQRPGQDVCPVLVGGR